MTFSNLVGKTITNATEMVKNDYDDKAWLKLEFSDGTTCVIYAKYDEYTGRSENEYPVLIAITDIMKDLVPTKNWHVCADIGKVECQLSPS